MEIQSLSQQRHELSIVEPQRPDVDNRTYALIVLRSLLVNIGAALAMGSLYVLTFVNPLFLFTSPTLIILGVMLKNPNETNRSSHPTDPATSALGLKRLGFNCWVNASFQALFALNPIRRQMEGIRSNLTSSEKKAIIQAVRLHAVTNAFSRFSSEMDIVNGRTGISSIETQDLRIWMNRYQEGTEFTKNPYVQHDAMQFIQTLYEELEICYSIKETFYHTMEDGKTFTTSQDLSQSNGWIGIDMVGMKKDLPFSELFDRSLSSGQIEGYKFQRPDTGIEEKTASTTRRIELLSAPEVLTFHAKRYNRVSEHDPEGKIVSCHLSKNGDSIPFPDEFSLGEHCPSEPEARYRIKSFILHEGSLDSGHYTAYVRQKNEWILANDSQITRGVDISRALPKAYGVFYEKVTG